MGKALIIVESPTKIKTLQKFLGKGYAFASSVGHIRDLPKKGFGIDFENNFEPTYELLPEKKEVIAKLKKAAKEADIVYLAPDPDREGEAIAWHIASILPRTTKMKRVTFNAITKEAVSEALNHPREIDDSLVDAQQARRLLDRIVGYKISPILQRRIQKRGGGALSAGRVQSVALKLVVDREKEIEAFTPKEYWNIYCTLTADQTTFSATLHSIDGKKIDKEPNPDKNIISITNQTDAHAIEKDLKNGTYLIESVEKKEKKRHPVPPFITSTLQQEASRHYGFSASRTMSVAQSLYEGVDLGEHGTQGLITYMRTDSVRVEPESIKHVRSYIQKSFGKEYLPYSPKQYTTKKSAQDAHEAIRPTNVIYDPEKIKKYLNDDQYKLYKLVWRRFVASQMNPAIYDTLTCDISSGKYILRTTGSLIKFNGFLAVYEEKRDTETTESGEQELPDLKEGTKPSLKEIKPVQSFTKPPPRFTEASLVKELEKSGIGRPSTYATIMNKIQSRDYTTKERQQLKPTELGRIIAEMLETHFALIMDIGFTARMEDELDDIASEHLEWKRFLKDFWTQFEPIVETAEKEAVVPKIETDIDCPKCGSKLQKIWAKGKYFYGCSQYPECDFTTSIEAFEFDKSEYAEDFDWDQNCPKCGGDMVLRHGRYGAFLGCSNYPDCNGIVNIPKKGETPPEEMPDCPAIGCDGKIQMRRSRFGKIFFSCNNYPDCDVIVNDLDDLKEKYPNHPKTPYIKKTKKKGAKKKTSGKKTATKKREQPKYTLSKELQAVVKETSLSRPEVTKKIWDYIKEHNLQDPKNKRTIVPDAALAKVFGSSEPIDMMKLAGKLSPHFKK